MSTRSHRPQNDQHVAQSAPQSTSTAEWPAAMISPTPKLLVTATEASSYLSVSKAHIYRLLQAGELRAVHTNGVGRGSGAMRIPFSELTRYVERLLQAATDADENPR